MVTTEEQEQLDNEILDLRNICPAFEDYVVNQVYLSKYGPDAYTDADILRDGYEIIQAELEDMGIYIDGDLFEDGYQRRFLYYFRKFFDGNQLKELFRKHNEWKETIQVILDSDENLNDTLNELLEFFYNVYGYNYDVRQLYEKWLECTSNELFDEHLKAVLEDAPAIVSSITDPEVATAYVSFIEKGRQNAYTAARMIYDSLVKREYGEQVKLAMVGITWEDILPYLEKYDLDKVSADEVSSYAIFDTDFNKEELPECIQLKAKEYMDAHHKRSHHHIEYWDNKWANLPSFSKGHNAPDRMIPPAAMIVLVAHHYSPGMDATAMRTAVRKMTKDTRLVIQQDKNVMLELCDAFEI